MMITQFMPLGSMLDYVIEHRGKIDSKTMLNWFVQIAEGMAYLEGLRLVHRDLAARNVLVKTPLSVRIADFGMSKLLKHDTEVYESPGGKVALKWLAPECFKLKIFTSKSDVWAFGVTIWEVLTYGTIPYTETNPRDVYDLITTGVRLHKPDNCTLELYGLLLLCWTFQPELRPTFSDLKISLTEMASDPSRYLVTNENNLKRLLELEKKVKNSLYEILSELDGSNAEIMEAEQYAIQKNVQNPPVNTNNCPATSYLEILSRNKSESSEGYLPPNPSCELNYLKMDGQITAQRAHNSTADAKPSQNLYMRVLSIFEYENDNQESNASVSFVNETNHEPDDAEKV
jgi:epidermal growth factor receptor